MVKALFTSFSFELLHFLLPIAVSYLHSYRLSLVLLHFQTLA